MTCVIKNMLKINSPKNKSTLNLKLVQTENWSETNLNNDF